MTIVDYGLIPVGAMAGVTVLVNQKSVQAGDTVSAAATNTAETPFASTMLTLPANSLKPGESFTLECGGGFTSSLGGPFQRPRIRLGAVALADAGDLNLLAGATNASWSARCNFSVRTIGTSGTVEASAVLTFATSATASQVVSAGPLGGGSANGSPVTIDTTVPLMFRLTTMYANATAGNSTTVRTCTLIKRAAT